MDLSEEDQRVAVSAASAMSLKRPISSLDLADKIKRAQRAEYMKQYNARPEVKAKKAEYKKFWKMKEIMKSYLQDFFHFMDGEAKRILMKHFGWTQPMQTK